MSVPEAKPFLSGVLVRRALFFALLLLALGARWYRLDYRSFVVDEFKTVRSLGMPSLALMQERLSQGHPPLYFMALKGWATMFGNGPKTVRALSVLFSLLALVYIFLTARFVWGGKCALWALLIGAIHQEAIWGAQDARPYALLLLATAASVHALVHALHTRQTRWWWAYGLWCTAGILTHVSFVFLFVGQLLVVGLWLARARRWRGDWALAALLTLASILLVLFVLKHFNQKRFAEQGSRWAAVNMLKGSRGLFLGGFDRGLGRLPDGLGVVAIVGLLIWGGREARRRRLAFAVPEATDSTLSNSTPAMDVPLFSLALAWAWGVPIGLVLMSLAAGGTLTQVRYYAVGAGGGTLALAIGLTAVRPRWLKGALAVFCIASLAALSIQWHRSEGNGLREAFQYVEGHSTPDELLILRMSESSTVADYYDLQGPHVYIDSPNEEKRIAKALGDAATAGNGFWLVKLQYGKEKYPIGKELTALMQTRFRLEKDQSFSHTHIWHYLVAK